MSLTTDPVYRCQARVVISDWKHDYNHRRQAPRRPHTRLSHLTRTDANTTGCG